MTYRTAVLAAMLMLGASQAALADDGMADDAAALRALLDERYPDLRVDEVRPSPLTDIYEVVSGTQVFYMTADARYALRGSLIDLVAERNLTAERKSQRSHAAVAELGEQDMVIYEPADGESEHVVTVFTDTSCAYCRRLHEEMLEAVDEHGIRLRYVMFPRAGVDSAAADTLRNVWCADDPQAAMTRAKRGKTVPERDGGCNPPIAEQYETGRAIGVSGTPYLLLEEDGPVFAGYRPVDQLLAMMRGSGGG